MMEYDFLRPAFLWLLLLVPVIFFWPKRHLDLIAGLRALAFILLVLAVARPVVVHDDAPAHRVWILDASASVSEQSLRRAVGEVAELIAQDDSSRHHLVTFGGDRKVGPPIEGLATKQALVSSKTSDLGAAIATGLAAIPMGSQGRVVLFSDGAATDASWREFAARAEQRDIGLDCRLLIEESAGLRLRECRPLGEFRVGHEATWELTFSGGPTSCDFALYEGEDLVVERKGLGVALESRYEFNVKPRRAGFIDYTMKLSQEGKEIQSLRRCVAVQDPYSVLYVGDRIEGAAGVLSDLVGAGYAIQSPTGRVSAETLAGSDLLILDDCPASKLAPGFLGDVRRAVEQEGLGLFASGGRAAFGSGGWHETEIAEILPVRMVQREEKKDPSTSLAVIIDTSGSMSGNRIRLAKEVTRLAIRRLLPHDKVGIVEFYGNKRWAAPLQSAANSLEIQRAMNRLDAGGGTVLFPAIEEAYYGLKNVQTRYKHVLVLTDAGVETGPYENLMRKMARDGITVSTVLVGPGRHSDFLVQMADWGGGRYYNASNRFNLPEILLKQPSTSRLPAYRPGTIQLNRRGSQRWWPKGVDKAPALNAYVETRPRPGAEDILLTSKDGHPVLSSWRHGLGRVTTFASEPAGPGSQSWRDWERGGDFMARVLGATSSLARRKYRFVLERDEARAQFRLIAIRLSPQAEAPRASIDGGDALTLTERAPGTWVAVGALQRDQDLKIMAGAGSSAPDRLISEAPSSYPGEGTRPQAFQLTQAEWQYQGWGEFSSQSAQLGDFAAGPMARPRALSELRPWFFGIALLIYLFEILWRRRPDAAVKEITT